MANEKRLIDSMDTVIKISKAVTPLVNAGCNDEWVCKRIYDKVLTCIAEAPTVDAVEVVHGRWEKEDPDKHGNRKPKCSVCGKYHLAWWSDYTHCNYCPNCGAKMDGDGNDN